MSEQEDGFVKVTSRKSNRKIKRKQKMISELISPPSEMDFPVESSNTRNDSPKISSGIVLRKRRYIKYPK
uniref:Uncharacterized protein n=1 Tax=Arundo donax TaxID=35708 RepID=A0A0A8YQ51_ARUDO